MGALVENDAVAHATEVAEVHLGTVAWPHQEVGGLDVAVDVGVSRACGVETLGAEHGLRQHIDPHAQRGLSRAVVAQVRGSSGMT